MTNEEINKTIHEKLFGGCWHQFVFSGNVAKCEKCDFKTDISEHDFYMGEPSNPDYCGVIADAWRVVEKMESLGFVWTFSNNGNEYAPTYDARFFREDKRAGVPDVRVIEIAETLSEAICCAALKVLEEG